MTNNQKRVIENHKRLLNECETEVDIDKARFWIKRALAVGMISRAQFDEIVKFGKSRRVEIQNGQQLELL